jgi:hypothetical protein
MPNTGRQVMVRRSAPTGAVAGDDVRVDVGDATVAELEVLDIVEAGAVGSDGLVAGEGVVWS